MRQMRNKITISWQFKKFGMAPVVLENIVIKFINHAKTEFRGYCGVEKRNIQRKVIFDFIGHLQ